MPEILPPRAPFARGVTQLMYVGDDENYEDTRIRKIAYANLLAAAVAGGIAISSKGATRKVAAGAAAVALYTWFQTGVWAV